MNTYTIKNIEHALDELDIQRGDCVLVRADLRYLGLFAPEPRQAPAVLFQALAHRVDLTVGTLLVPTGSLSLCNSSTPFDPKTTPSELGVFSEYVRTREGAVRSFHPFFSYTALGAEAEEICSSVPRCNVPIGCSPCLKPVKLELTDNSKPSRGQGEQP
ncbi:hypothetical protein FYJ44_13560 [Desulfovibrio sp. PG-178-WT-4]|uniref:Aminoglycoside N(3)-acetyltransferase n=1 Tax=Desulfovibrio porci TaxID=2605782 RepID=A0A6L5XPM2_9BACT|nr:AAC(3) family N-acetyltransferase [Desulfovibrio porci]MSS29025.1 hypothetical protein [Desulfovibrio porci]